MAQWQRAGDTGGASPGQEDPLEEVFLLRKSHGPEKPGSLQAARDHKELDMTEQLSRHTHVNICSSRF